MLRSSHRFFSTPKSLKLNNTPNLFPYFAILSIPAFGYYYYSTSTRKVPALQGDKFIPFKLSEIINVNHNTKAFRFEIPSGTTELGLPITSCLLTKWVKGVKEDGKEDVVIRPYTPVTIGTDEKHFDLVIKKYEAGNMSKHIHSLKPGDVLEMKGPIPKYKYHANYYDHVGMIAGGTGITPMLQLIDHIKKNKEDKTKISLIYANTEEEDILMREYLDNVKKSGADDVYYVLSNPPKDWKEGKGYVSEQDVEKFMPKPGKGKVFVCGPPGMMKMVSGEKNRMEQGELQGILKKLGYKEADIYKF